MMNQTSATKTRLRTGRDGTSAHPVSSSTNTKPLTSNRKHPASPLPCSHRSSLSTAKLTLCSFVIAVILVYSLQKFRIFQIIFPDTGEHFWNSYNTGGWKLATEEVINKYGTERCTIERISVLDLTPERFESEVRFKKPVIVTFPKGARDWTDPDKWSRQELVKSYSKWTIHSGHSLEIVRKGGNAKHASSFEDFVDNLINSHANATHEPMHYAFDRHFYRQSDLPKTLRLPKYFKVNVSEDDSIFFLGSSMTGVVFHKHSDTWNGVVYGRKRWFLYPNSKTPPGGVHHGFSLLEWVGRVYTNLTEKDKPVECVQGPGEILYLPEGTYHATLNLGDTIAVAIQKKDPTIQAEVLSYEATKLIGFLQQQTNPDPKNSFSQRLLEVYKKWLELLPESSEAVMKIGDILYEMGEYTESLPWHQRAIEMDPYFVLAYLHLGNTFAKLHKPIEADKAFRKAIALSPNLWDNYKEYGEFLLKQGRHADALPVFKKGTKLMPDMIPFWFFYKLCQDHVGDREGAAASEKVIQNLKANTG